MELCERQVGCFAFNFSRVDHHASCHVAIFEDSIRHSVCYGMSNVQLHQPAAQNLGETPVLSHLVHIVQCQGLDLVIKVSNNIKHFL